MTKRAVIATITLPVRTLMLNTDKKGALPMLFSDCVANITEGENKLGEIGGAMSGALHMRLSAGDGWGNTYTVRVADIWNALVDMVKANPELAPGTDIESLGYIESDFKEKAHENKGT